MPEVFMIMSSLSSLMAGLMRRDYAFALSMFESVKLVDDLTLDFYLLFDSSPVRDLVSSSVMSRW